MSIGPQAARKKFQTRRMACIFITVILAGCSSSRLSAGRTSTTIFSDEWIEGEGLAVPKDLAPVILTNSEKLVVVGTTSIVADVIATVGGGAIELATLIPAGTDPHAYEPKAGDYHRMADAHVVFISGAGLETFIDEILGQISGDVPIVSLSGDVELRRYAKHDSIFEVDVATDQEVRDSQEHMNEVDPHVWLDPLNVVQWTENAASALIALDPGNADIYQDNAKHYIGQLEGLHAWIEDALAQIPNQNRKLVSDHRLFGYFTDRYGFKVVGSVVSAYSTAAATSAHELAVLEDLILESGVKAIFVGETGSRRLADQIAADTGIKVIMLYTGSLGQSGGQAGTYIEFMEHNVQTIVQALGR
jgi:ABC-type Zn uptake system ZnuABC Zn-binding protein ZnuA